MDGRILYFLLLRLNYASHAMNASLKLCMPAAILCNEVYDFVQNEMETPRETREKEMTVLILLYVNQISD